MNWLAEDPPFWKTYRKDEKNEVLLQGWGKCWSKLRGCKRWWRRRIIFSLNIGKTSGTQISQTAWDLRCFEHVLSGIPQRDLIIRKRWACSLWSCCPLFSRSKDYLISLSPVPALHFSWCMYQAKKEPALPVVRNWPLALCASMPKHVLAASGAVPACVCGEFCSRYPCALWCTSQDLQGERLSSAVYLLLYTAWRIFLWVIYCYIWMLWAFKNVSL